MVDLTLHGNDGPVLRHDIAARQEISADYVAQLVRQLREAGLVTGIKGPGGGYKLARDAASIRVGDIIRAVEGPIAVAPCTAPENNCPYNRDDNCVSHRFWRKLTLMIEGFVDEITLQDVCNDKG
jgi:Rrf2 family protein